ncbi:beta-1,6-N-acetylglucosaminyltransferase [Cyclobacterium jeungdonense]|uniref:Peptide O-xylosyltransferase n=1 Tax=Cyclobacterium jeungdonense TaxID=708087 RepID=A0ABT8C2H4_9BACT|nr:beta-1,6-N-acetylglucosaminyltransferase [Cyclobacterium jeungdonense]MDN3686552.1 beta-1,6-N-acetylglucosaminyltransferase [Cyclobacterium jeungdonense]
MKHAILFLAYKNIDHLVEYINCLDDDFLFYIHLDKKSKIKSASIEKLYRQKNVEIISREYSVNWGGLNLLKALLLLAKEALKNKEIGYLHSMSGQDFPIKSCKEIKNFFKEHKGKQFIEHFPLPSNRWAGGGMNRLDYYNFYDVFNKKTKLGTQLISASLKIQKFLGFKRKPFAAFPKLYGGSVWWSLSSCCVSYVINLLDKDPAIMERMKHTHCPEEILFQSVLMNSHFEPSIIGKTMTLVLWEYRNGNSPATLDKSDLQKVLKSNKLFARKFEYPVSKELVRLIKKEVA